MVGLVLEQKRLGHRAFTCASDAHVVEKAKGLPKNGVPPEIVRLLPHDDDLDKIQIQKAATPVEGRKGGVKSSAFFFVLCCFC